MASQDHHEGPVEEGSHHHVPTHSAPNTTRRVVVFASALVLGLCAIFVFRYFTQRHRDTSLNAELEQSSSQPLIVDVVHARPGTQSKELKLPGDARPYYDTTVFARTSGYLKDVKVDIGDLVGVGDVLATIETPDLDDQLVAANAKLDELNAQVGVAQTSRDFARISFKRWDESTSDGSVSKQERDQKKSELDSAEAKLKAAEAQVALGKAEIKRLETMENFKQVRAPFAGVITERHVDPGELVTAGSTTNTSPLFSIVSVDKIRVVVDVPQNTAPDVKQKMSATVTFAGRDFPGTVERTSGSIDRSSRTMRVEVLVPNPEHALIPGVHVQVALQTAHGKPQLQVPASALLFRSRGPAVAAVAPDGKVTIKEVRITRDSGDFVEVDGLTPNEIVALNISNSIMDGDVVKMNDLDKEKDKEKKPAAPVPAHKNVAASAAPTTRVSDSSTPAGKGPAIP